MKYRFSKDLAEIYIRLCHGQMLDIGFENREFNDLTMDEITKMQYLKTGVLFEFSCMTGARIALNKMEDPLIDVVQKYAKLAGTAFQIQDDIIGLVGEEETVGKPIGSDITEGKRTLIAVHAVTHANSEQKKVLLHALGNHNATSDEIRACLDTMKEIGSIQYAFDMARDMAKEAAELTDQLPENDNTALLKNFAAYMIERKF
jgi:geranylgeranyl diphosphate synthase type I